VQQTPLPWFTTVRQSYQVKRVVGESHLYAALADGTLPSVSWVMPYATVGEHPENGKHVIWRGMCHVTSVVNAIMKSPEWSSTAIFLMWDDWGGFYDHVPPIRIDQLGYGIRVPALGNLLNEFTFSGNPLPPLVLDPTPLNPSDPTPPPGRDASAEEHLCAPDKS
jgi:phospholipase C